MFLFNPAIAKHCSRIFIYLNQTSRSLDRGESGKALTGFDSLVPQARHPQLRDSANGPKASIAKLFEQGTCHWLIVFDMVGFVDFLNWFFHMAVGLQKILSLLESEDHDVRVHAVKVVANLAAEGEH